MKVLVFGMTDVAGGTESVIMNYYRNIDRSKIQFDFLCNNNTVAYQDEIKSLGGKIIHVPMRSKGVHAFRQAMDSFFKEHAKDYAAIWVNVSSLANVDYLKYAKKYEIPVRIIHSHNSANMDGRLRGLLHRWNRKKIGQLANVYWACSQSAANWFYNKSLQESPRFSIVKNAISLQRCAFDPHRREEVRKKMDAQSRFVVGNVGRLHFTKNQTFLLDIFKEILERKPEAELWLAGIGEDEAMLKEKAKSLGIAGNVRFLHARNDVPDLLQAMDVFVMPSVMEGLPVALLEAQAASLPSFVSREAVTDEAKAVDYVTFLSLNDSAKTWAEAILKATADRSSLDPSAMIQAGFSIEDEAKKMEQFFLSCPDRS